MSWVRMGQGHSALAEYPQRTRAHTLLRAPPDDSGLVADILEERAVTKIDLLCFLPITMHTLPSCTVLSP